MFFRSLSTDALSSGVAPAMRVETESVWRRRFIAAIVVRIAWLTCRVTASSVICGVIFGFPSRSPPIHVPNVRGRAVAGS